MHSNGFAPKPKRVFTVYETQNGFIMLPDHVYDVANNRFQHPRDGYVAGDVNELAALIKKLMAEEKPDGKKS